MNNKTQEEELDYQNLMNKIGRIEKNQLDSHEKLIASMVGLTREIIVCVVIATIIILVLN